MSIEAIAAIGPMQSLTASSSPAMQTSSSFSAVLDQMSQLTEQMALNEQAVQRLALGESDNLHQVMMNMEKVRLQFDLMLQVRNKVMEAYQELMRMQV